MCSVYVYSINCVCIIYFLFSLIIIAHIGYIFICLYLYCFFYIFDTSILFYTTQSLCTLSYIYIIHIQVVYIVRWGGEYFFFYVRYYPICAILIYYTVWITINRFKSVYKILPFILILIYSIYITLIY